MHGTVVTYHREESGVVFWELSIPVHKTSFMAVGHDVLTTCLPLDMCKFKINSQMVGLGPAWVVSWIEGVIRLIYMLDALCCCSIGPLL